MSSFIDNRFAKSNLGLSNRHFTFKLHDGQKLYPLITQILILVQNCSSCSLGSSLGQLSVFLTRSIILVKKMSVLLTRIIVTVTKAHFSKKKSSVFFTRSIILIKKGQSFSLEVSLQSKKSLYLPHYKNIVTVENTYFSCILRNKNICLSHQKYQCSQKMLVLLTRSIVTVENSFFTQKFVRLTHQNYCYSLKCKFQPKNLLSFSLEVSFQSKKCQFC